MAVIDKNNLQAFGLAASHYGFSAVRIEDLGAAEYTLVTIVADVSPSTDRFRKKMEAAIGSVVDACGASPRRHNLLVRLMAFASDVSEVHGFRPLSDCAPADYVGVLTSLRGTTALYDASVNGIEATSTYGEKLLSSGYSVNGLVVVLTDGVDNDSTLTVREVKAALGEASSAEKLESLVSILVGVNADDCSRYLKAYAADAGFTQYVDMGAANAKNLSRLADFMSRSISAQSVALGTGGPSTLLRF